MPITNVIGRRIRMSEFIGGSFGLDILFFVYFFNPEASTFPDIFIESEGRHNFVCVFAVNVFDFGRVVK